MDEVLTVEEMERRYDSEWLLIDEPETDPQRGLIRGKVVFHSKDRDEVYRQALADRRKRMAFWFTGSIPPNIEAIL